MSALKGSLTYSRLYVDGQVPAGFHEHYLAAVQKHAMRPLDPSEPDAERTGFCRIGEPFELEFQGEHVFFDDFINLGLRTDRWAIPAALLKAKLREAEKVFLTKSGRERMTKKEKLELKEMVSMQLRRMTAPQTRAIDISWSLDEKLVRFFSHSPRAIAHVTELFAKSFQLKLVPESPYTLAARLGLEPAQEQAIAGLQLSEFAHHGGFDMTVEV